MLVLPGKSWANGQTKGYDMGIENSNWQEFTLTCNGGGGCVVVERIAGAVVIRDSKNPYQPGLVFSGKEYADFRRRVQTDSWSVTMPRRAASVLRSVALILRVTR
jgi:Domain of unknown function (DUF397)